MEREDNLPATSQDEPNNPDGELERILLVNMVYFKYIQLIGPLLECYQFFNEICWCR